VKLFSKIDSFYYLNGVRIFCVLAIEEVRASERVDDDVATFDVDKSGLVFVQSSGKPVEGTSATMLLDVLHVHEKVKF
jgi:hypothetical protein